MLYFGVDLFKNHIVDRYFETVKSIGVYNDNKGINYTLNPTTNIDFNTKQDYIAWIIGGSYETKKLSQKQIGDVISKLDIPVVLIGGTTEHEIADLIINNLLDKKIYNFCGMISLDQSALLIKHSKLVLTNDTGMMHISSAFSNPIISFWGCTKPSLGFSPYMPKNKFKNLISEMSKKPCSKHGQYCNYLNDGCVKSISADEICSTIKKLANNALSSEASSAFNLPARINESCLLLSALSYRLFSNFDSGLTSHTLVGRPISSTATKV